MIPVVHPFLGMLLDSNAPRVEVLDFQSSTADLTTYTFTAVNGIAAALGTTMTIAGDAYNANPHIRSQGRRFIEVNVHGRDALTVFTVTSCSIGGVAGTKLADAGSESQLVLTAAFIWDTQALQGITNTDVVVVFSEAVTSCGIGVLSVKNVGIFQNVTTHTWSSGSDAVHNLFGPATATIDINPLLIGAGTFNGGGVLPTLFENLGAEGSRPVEVAYMSSDAEMSYYCGWTYVPQYSYNNDPVASFRVDYAGAAFEASVAIGFV